MKKTLDYLFGASVEERELCCCYENERRQAALLTVEPQQRQMRVCIFVFLQTMRWRLLSLLIVTVSMLPLCSDIDT